MRAGVKARSLTVTVHAEVRGVSAEVSGVILTSVRMKRAGDALRRRMTICGDRNPEKQMFCKRNERDVTYQLINCFPLFLGGRYGLVPGQKIMTFQNFF